MAPEDDGRMTTLDLARWEGWRTEPRDKRGRWTRGETEALIKTIAADGAKRRAAAAQRRSKPIVAKGTATSEISGAAVHDHLGKPSLSPAQKKAFSAYQDPTGGGYLNDYLHGIKYRGKPDAAEKQAAVMDSVFKDAKPTDKPMVLYRGMNAKGLSVGKTFSDNGFVSTTTEPAIASEYSEGKPIVRVHVPAGSKAISVAHMVGENPHSKITSDALGTTDEDTGDAVEREALLPRGSKFKVTGISGQYIDVEMQPS
jgi:hypothetical protein